MELSMVSARFRHDEALGRKDAVHLPSDELSGGADTLRELPPVDGSQLGHDRCAW